MIDPVDDVADVVEICGDLGEFGFPGRCAQVFHDVAGDAADDACVAMPVLGKAHRPHDFVGAVDEGLRLGVRLHILQGEQPGLRRFVYGGSLHRGSALV